jgi:hypothetical protein
VEAAYDCQPLHHDGPCTPQPISYDGVYELCDGVYINPHTCEPDDPVRVHEGQLSFAVYGVEGFCYQDFSDTERLDYLLSFIRIDDVGDEQSCLGIVVNDERLETALGFGPENSDHILTPNIHSYDDNLRDVIDRSIAAHEGSIFPNAKSDSQSPTKKL